MTGADLAVVPQDDLIIATASGEVDAANADALARGIEARVGSARTVVFDLSGLEYLDSAGIHMLFRLGRRLDERGRGLRLVVPEGCVVRDTLRYADTLESFDVRGSLAEAGVTD